MKILPLAPRQSVHVQPRGTTGSPNLQRLEFVQSLVEPSGEVSLVSSYLLKGLLVRQKALPS